MAHLFFSQLFLPTILSDFFAYSIANYDNWSWGTRESNPQSTPSTATHGAAGGVVQPARLPNPLRAAEELVSNKIRARSQRAARSMHQATTSSLVILQLGLAIFLIVFSVRQQGHVSLSWVCMLFPLTVFCQVVIEVHVSGYFSESCLAVSAAQLYTC